MKQWNEDPTNRARRDREQLNRAIERIQLLYSWQQRAVVALMYLRDIGGKPIGINLNALIDEAEKDWEK